MSDNEEQSKMIMQFQIMQQQLQNVMIQKESLKLNIMEIDQALEELDKSGNKDAYKITGSVMISKPAADIKKELSENKDLLNIRLNSMEKNEKELTAKLTELQEKLKQSMKG